MNRQFVLRELEKEQWVSWMREYERFRGMRVITYCIMSNHFHILLEVLKRPAEGLSDAELEARLEGLSGMTEAGTIKQWLAWFRERGFVNEVYGVFRERFGPKRKIGTRRMRYVAHGGMYSPRDLTADNANERGLKGEIILDFSSGNIYRGGSLVNLGGVLKPTRAETC